MRTIGKIKACNLIQKIGSRRGSSSIMIFFSFTVAALMMSMVILQYSHVYLATEHTQMLADVTADGITVGADSGWGLIYSTSSKGYQDCAVKVKEKLISANTDKSGSDASYLIEDDYDAKVSLKSSKKSGEKGIRQAYYTIQGKRVDNAINVKVTGRTSNILPLIEDTYSVRREATSVLNSPTGGIRVAMYAYSFSDSAEAHGRLNPAVSHRTRYVWGAGRGGAEDTSWQQYTDCSGFVSGVYKHFTDDSGKRYFFTAYTGALQTVGECVYRGYSSGVDLKKLQPGDIICYWWGSSGYGDSEHVGIYFGDGYQVDCSGGSQNHSPGTMGYGVKFRKIPSAYIDTYTVKETSASKGFIVNPGSFTYTNGAGTLEIPETPQKLEINLQKLTQNGKAYPITSEFGFAGAEYTIYNKNTGNEVGKIAVNNDGAGTLTNMWLGEYTLKETKLPTCNAYLKDEAVHTVSATAEGGVVVDGQKQKEIGLALNKAAANSTERFHYGSMKHV